MTNAKPAVGAIVPQMTFPKLGGGELTFGGTRDRWSFIAVSIARGARDTLINSTTCCPIGRR